MFHRQSVFELTLSDNYQLKAAVKRPPTARLPHPRDDRSPTAVLSSNAMRCLLNSMSSSIPEEGCRKNLQSKSEGLV